MSDPTIADRISVFLSRINSRRFDQESLRILELLLVAKDVKSLSEVRSILRYFVRSQSTAVFREIAGESVVRKLSVLEFFVHAFALIGDMESCLAMRYEALTLRELKAPSCQWLRVSHTEWARFAEQLLENGFSAIARKACENALLSLKSDSFIESNQEEYSKILDAAEKVRRLRDSAMTLKSSHSVQAQAAEYLRSKGLRNRKAQPPPIKKGDCTGSTLFREGIRKRNERMWQELRSIPMTAETHSLPCPFTTVCLNSSPHSVRLKSRLALG